MIRAWRWRILLSRSGARPRARELFKLEAIGLSINNVIPFRAGEVARSLSKRAFTRALQSLVPEIEERDLAHAPAGVRAQALARDGALVDDFAIVQRDNALHVLNAPSPAATASLAIAEEIANAVL